MALSASKQKKERKLIKEFLDNFYEKVGYYPTVITKDNTIKTKDGIKILSLNQLEDYFNEHLPMNSVYGKKLTIKTPVRYRSLVELRFIFFFIARAMRYSLMEIAFYCGGKDHTTVIHGLKTFRNLFETDDKFRDKYYKIINKIKEDYEPSVMEHLDQMECES